MRGTNLFGNETRQWQAGNNGANWVAINVLACAGLIEKGSEVLVLACLDKVGIRGSVWAETVLNAKRALATVN